LDEYTVKIVDKQLLFGFKKCFQVRGTLARRAKLVTTWLFYRHVLDEEEPVFKKLQDAGFSS